MRQRVGRIASVTGGNSGIGREVARGLARRGARVVILGRSAERCEAARVELARETGARVDVVLADLADFGAVRRAADELRRLSDRLDLLVANAGVWLARRELTPDGLERTMAANHLGHFLLTNLLREPIERARGRIVVVTSEAHRRGRLTERTLEEIFRGVGRYSGTQAYADSKLANVLFTFELARRLDGTGVTANAVHPGVVATRIWRRGRGVLGFLARLAKPFMASPREGARPVLRVATDPDLEGVTGRYFDRMDERRAVDAAYDRALARRLWQVSAELTGLADRG